MRPLQGYSKGKDTVPVLSGETTEEPGGFLDDSVMEPLYEILRLLWMFIFI